MLPRKFFDTYYSVALVSEKDTGVSALFTLAQAALESNFGNAAPGNMFFGVKDTDGINGNEQLLRTTEYLKVSNAKFPVIISVKPVVIKGVKFFEYKIKDYFRKYNTPADSFKAHGQMFAKSERYKFAMLAKNDPYVFAKRVADAGYATDPSYYQKITKLIDLFKLFVE